MNKLKKFLAVFLSFFPLSASAVAPWLIGVGIGAGAIAGFSIYRSSAPVNMQDALSFFSTCWTCQLFADIMSGMSDLLPRAYSALASVILPVSVILAMIWFAWRMFSGFLNAKAESGWNITGNFGVLVVKLAVVAALLFFPLPRLMSDVVIEPIFNVGLSLNRAVTGNDTFAQCVVATAVADPVARDKSYASRGAFSPKLRHNLACEVANIHQMTGLGMTVGWTMLSMAFNHNYMHKIMWGIPIFPNVPIFFVGLLILVLFFAALIPIPLYFLEVFIKLSLDMVMLPLLLMAWLFSDWEWKIFPNTKTIKGIIDDVIKGTVGIAMVGVFVTFAIMFLDAVFGKWGGAAALQEALAANDPTILMNGLMMQNDSLITITLMGIFIAMFMIMIPTLIETLFANVKVPESFYKSAKKDAEVLWGGLKKWYSTIKK